MLRVFGLVYEYDSTYLEFMRQSVLPDIRSFIIYQVRSRVYNTTLFMIYNQSIFIVTDNIFEPSWKCTHFICGTQPYTEIIQKFTDYRKYTGEVPREIVFCGERITWNDFLDDLNPYNQ